MKQSTLFTAALLLGMAAANETPTPTPQQICAARTNQNVTTEDCELMPVWGNTIQTFGVDSTWKRHDVTTSEGNILAVVRLTGDSSNTPPATEKGPILLTACAYYDGYAFFQLNDPTKPVMPVQLMQEGYDVWIANRRGTIHSQGNTESLLENDPEAYFDFELEDIALVDYPALISYILETRRTDGLPCKKLSLYADGHSAAEMAYMMATYPSSASEWIAQQVSLTPCFLFDAFVVDVVVDLKYDPTAGEENPCDDEEEEVEEGGDGYRKLKKSKRSKSPKKSNECKATWDSREYYESMAEIKASLSRSDYRDFSREFKEWSRTYGKEWKYGGAWQKASLEIYCQYNIADEDCAPLAFERYNGFVKAVTEIQSFPSFYGSDWPDTVDFVCENWPGKSCANYNTLFDVSYPFGFRETSLKELRFISQNALRRSFARFSPDFATSGWYAERDEFDLSTINVPMRALFLETDIICPKEANLEILKTIPTSGETVSVIGKRHFDIVGDNDDLMNYSRLALLSPNAGEMIEGTCADIDFTDWRA